MMNIVCCIDGGCKHHPCDIRPHKHRRRGKWFVDEICVDYSQNNHEDEHH